MTAKILLFGSTGQVGWELQRSLSVLGSVVALGRREGDLQNLDDLNTVIRRESPDTIVNAAAYTAVDKAESEEAEARAINRDAVEVLARGAKSLDALLVHYSTDYVCDGSKSEPYSEEDAPRPLSVYGRTKLEGERAIAGSGCKHVIFRTSWVYAARGNNFVRTILRLAQERDELNVVADQVGAPTSAELIADVTALCLAFLMRSGEERTTFNGVYNLAASGTTNWHEYAKFIVEYAIQMGLPLKLLPARIHAIATSEYPTPAKRPRNSRLDTRKLTSTFGLELPHWQLHVKRAISELAAAEGA